jgi:enolase
VTEITDVDAWEVLDSRGEPTVRVAVAAGDARGVFTVPAGASTGAHEAHELRDGGSRYGGLGVRAAVANVREELAPLVVGRDVTDQRAIDAAIVDHDGTAALSTLGANAALGVSGAVARAASHARGVALYDSLAPEAPGRLPLPMVNAISGGLHAHGGIAVQDVLVVPTGADSYPEALETVWAVRRALRERIEAGGHRPLVADEGGFSPPLSGVEEAFDLVVEAIRDAGHEPAPHDVALAVDVAATHVHDPEAGTYDLEGTQLTQSALIEAILGWVETYPIVSLEDPLAEDDWAGWVALADRLPEGVQLLGDDLLVTNHERLERAIEAGAVTAVLVKPNQAGTITKAVDVIDRARDAGLAAVVSARSGETCDTTIADLAVARDAGQIKIGSLARSERLAKYNRLLAIDRATDAGLAGPFSG